MPVNGTELHVATAGQGPPVVLVHGWPHTWRLWHTVIPRLAPDHLVIAPDLRGLGASSRAASGYDLHTLADDLATLLDALGQTGALVAGIDLGAPVAWMLAMRHPRLVRRLALSESLLGDLPGAEAFLAKGPPWWFGFHQAPDLAETVLVGHEADYLDWFFRSGTDGGRGIDASVRDAFVAAYTGRTSLRCSFEHYRALPGNAVQIREALARGRLRQPTLALLGGTVGDAIARQLRPIADELTVRPIAGCKHLVPLEQPAAFADALRAFGA